MKYIFFGGFNLMGSGYTTIIKNIGLELQKQGHEIYILSEQYRGEQYKYPFTITYLQPQGLAEGIRYICDTLKPDEYRLFVAYDIPKICELSVWFKQYDRIDIINKMEIIIPIESYPVKMAWLNELKNFKKIYTISQFGKDILMQSGIESTYLPMGCDYATFERPDKNTARSLIKLPEDKTIYLMVTDNQERKNLPIVLEILSELPNDCELYMVTYPTRPHGWDLIDIITEFEIEDRVHIIQFPVDSGTLSLLYWSADALIVSSQAEGACLPVYEAFGHGLPVISGTWTGLQDVKDLPFVLPLEYEYSYRYAWGNALRFFASSNDLRKQMLFVRNNKDIMESLSKKALEYAREHTWVKSTEVING